jgi:hypothetical protein
VEEVMEGAREYQRNNLDAMVDRWGDKVKNLEVQFKEMQ